MLFFNMANDRLLKHSIERLKLQKNETFLYSLYQSAVFVDVVYQV